MNTFSFASVSIAAIIAVVAVNASPAEARGRGMSFSAPHVSTSGRSLARFSNRSSMRSSMKVKSLSLRTVHHKSQLRRVAKLDKITTRKHIASGLVKTQGFRSGQLKLGKLPVHKAIADKGGIAGKLGLPKSLKPKLTLAKAPGTDLRLRFAPFVQRHWKGAFFWVALAGVGYLTVPELYYDRFYRCAGLDDPDYEDCIGLLSRAVIEEEETVGRVRHPMPSAATYRYTAKTVPSAEARQTCSFEPFVERQWNHEFVWVQIPETGNVTVPADYYDRFYSKMGTEPPDYPAACKVLMEAAAADTVATTAPDLSRTL
jgi:hypothetical protein